MKRTAFILALIISLSLVTMAFAGQDWAGRYYDDPRSHNFATQASATYTTTTTSTSFALAGAKELQVVYQITAASGTTPSCTLKLQLSLDNTNWYDASGGAFAAKTTTGTDRLGIATPALYGRWVRTISGTTPSFTDKLTVSYRK